MRPHDEMEDELSPEERTAFAALPREREPSRLLEERTVRALRERGLVHAQAARPGRRLRFPTSWLVGAAAAAVALFMIGLQTGEMLAARRTAAVVETVIAKNPQQAAMQVQQTGSAYVTALGQLAALSSDSAGSGQAQQGREVAVQMLRAAANELVRISPDDPLAAGILAALDRTRKQQPQQQADTTGKERVVWF